MQFKCATAYRPQSPHPDVNALTLKIRQTLLDQHVAMVNYAHMRDQIILRLVICNNQTRPVDIVNFFEQVVKVGQQLEQVRALNPLESVTEA